MNLLCAECGCEIPDPKPTKKYCGKSCGDTARRRRWVEKDPERARASYRSKNKRYKKTIRNSHLKKMYGLLREDFDSLMNQQRHCCKICGIHIEEFADDIQHRACVDHDHDTGVVRGILCHACNRGLGQFRDRHDLILAAAVYLQSTR